MGVIFIYNNVFKFHVFSYRAKTHTHTHTHRTTHTHTDAHKDSEEYFLGAFCKNTTIIIPDSLRLLSKEVELCSHFLNIVRLEMYIYYFSSCTIDVNLLKISFYEKILI